MVVVHLGSLNLTPISQNVQIPEPPPPTPDPIEESKLETCASTRGYSDTVIPLMGLLLMIVGFGTIFITMRSGMTGSSNMSGTLILSSIMLIVVGFGLLIIGNYLLYAIYGVTC